MSDQLSFSKAIVKTEKSIFEFSICTLVTRFDEYQEMLQSFVNKGFTNDCTEYLHIDNSQECTFDAYQGLNHFLQKAQGKYVILCHQDILIHDNNKTNLLDLIAEVEEKDSNWAVLANAGGVNLKWIATHITQGNGRIIQENELPLKVKSVDENFIIVKKSANLALSSDLKGFHFYGTDICLIADILGYSCYVIGFNLTHKSNGKIDKSFFDSEKNIKNKYHKALRARFMTTTFSRIYFSGNSLGFYLYNTSFVLFWVRQYYKFFTKKSDYKL
jgi:Zn-finger protein